MKQKIPKDLKIKMGTPTEALWTNVKRNSEVRANTLEEELVVAKAMKELAESKIKEEQAKKDTEAF